MGGRGDRQRVPRRWHADHARGRGPQGVARARAVGVRRDAGRGGHDRGEPRHGRRAEAGRAARSGVRPSVDGRAVVRSLGARRAGARAPARVGDEGVPGRARGGLRQREPRPDLRSERGDDRVVGADARGGGRAVAGARQCVRAHDRAGDSARPPGGARRRAGAGPRPAGRHVRGGVPPARRGRATATTRSRTGRGPATSAGTTSGTGSGGPTSGSARARTATATGGGRGTSARRRSTCRWSSAASCPSVAPRSWSRPTPTSRRCSSDSGSSRASPRAGSTTAARSRTWRAASSSATTATSSRPSAGMLLLNELVLGLTG